MARGQRLSLVGLYQYDNTIFDNLSLPTQLDHDVCIYNLMAQTAELSLVYPDGDYIKAAIGFWSEKNLESWQRMADVLYEDYDPFINIKRHEERTITQDRDLTSTSDTGTVTKTNAWDDQSSEGVQRNKIDGEGTTTNTGQIVTKEVYDVEGDSAITDAQDVARKEIELRLNNLYDMIIRSFKREFCIMVY